MIIKKILFLTCLISLTGLNAQGVYTQKQYQKANHQYKAGLTLKYAYPSDENQKMAFHYLHKSAIVGHVLAQYEFALMFHYGLGVRQNGELARLWFTRAAKKGNLQAQEILYRFYGGKRPQYKGKNRFRYSQNFRTYR